MRFPSWLIFVLLILFCVPLHARPKPGKVTVKVQRDSIAQAYLHTSRPVVFEIGKLGLPWRRMDMIDSRGHIAKWQASKGRVYELWDAEDYAREQVRLAEETLRRQASAGRSVTDAAISALRLVRKCRATADSQQLRIAELRLSNALAALLDVRVNVKAGIDLKLWPEYTLPVEASVTSGSSGVRARFGMISKPDNWQVVSARTDRSWFSPAAGEGKPAVENVRVPAMSVFYSGSYPVTAWYDVRYRGVTFQVSNTAEAEIIHPFEKSGSIRTVSDTEIEFRVRLTSLLPIPKVRTELYLPDGWTGVVLEETFDLDRSKEIAYRISKPETEEPGLRIVGGVFRVGDYGSSRRLVAEHALSLGRSTGVTGFKMVWAEGEQPTADEFAGRSCRRAPTSGRMYFDVSENFMPGEETWLSVECAADGPVEAAVQYRSASGQIVTAQPLTTGEQTGWAKFVYVLKGARFDGSFSGKADFGLLCGGDSPRVAKLWISRFRLR